jgi:hypothetical protein
VTALSLAALYKPPAKSVQGAGTGIPKSQELQCLVDYRAVCMKNTWMRSVSGQGKQRITAILKSALSAIHICY